MKNAVFLYQEIYIQFSHKYAHVFREFCRFYSLNQEAAITLHTTTFFVWTSLFLQKEFFIFYCCKGGYAPHLRLSPTSVVIDFIVRKQKIVFF